MACLACGSWICSLWGCQPCRENGCWRGCCPFISEYMSFNKFVSVVPWWPIVSIIIFATAGIFILLGLEAVTGTVGIELDPIIVLLTQSSGVVLTLVNVTFAYSVCSNKLRIHNQHCVCPRQAHRRKRPCSRGFALP